MKKLNRKKNQERRQRITYSPLEARQLLATVDGSFYGPVPTVNQYFAPDALQENIAREFLANNEETAYLTQGESELELVEIKHGIASHVTRFRQTIAGVPVVDAYVTTVQGPRGDFVAYHDHGHSGLNTVADAMLFDFNDSEAAALEYAGAERTFAPTRGELVWLPGENKTASQVWQVTVFGVTAEQEHGDFYTFVDPSTGQVISQENQILNFATGSGEVFYPNPYQQNGSGAGITDNGDANSAALSSLEISVVLEGLDEGTGLLTGEFVDLANLNGDFDVDANEADRVYNYDRNDKRFEQVVIYHTVDQINRYFHSLGFDDDSGTPNGIRDFPTLASAHWYDQDQSFYSSGNDAIHFGDGGVDDGEDPDIIAHEYGHAIQNNQNAAWGGGEMGAMGEGFGDYLAASFFKTHGDAAFQANHAAAVGEWDATSYSSDNPPNLRRVDGNKTYADRVGQVHADGEIWSAALWVLNNDIGAAATDQLVLEAHFLMPASSSMIDGAEAILLADQNLNGGLYEANIRASFEARGILEPPATIGTVGFDSGVYSPGATVGVTVEDGNASTPVQVTVTTSGGDSETLTLAGSAIYTGSIVSATGSVAAGDGTLQVALGETITVSYFDSDDGNGGSFTTTDTAEIANVTQYTATDTPLNIPDNNATGITSTITITDTGTLIDADLQLDITHTWVGDLDATLTAPNGQTFVLFDRIGSDGDDYDNTYFDDSASQSINSGTAPFSGAFQPDESFTSLNGNIDIAGDWTLTIVDNAGQDIGTLNSWSLFLTVESTTSAVLTESLLFYGGSSFSASDQFDAVSIDKQPLLPGQTATFDNYTSYSLGINGIALEVNDLNTVPTLANVGDFFEFRVGNDNTPSGWATAPAPIDVVYQSDVNGAGTDRVFLVWADNAIENEWLQVNMLANSTTGLAAQSTFYYGNQIGETGNETNSTRVNLVDVGLTRTNQTGFTGAAIDNVYDFDRDGRVNLVDVAIARSNQTGFTSLALISPPAARAAVDGGKADNSSVVSFDQSVAEVATLDTAFASQRIDSLFSATQLDLGLAGAVAVRDVSNTDSTSHSESFCVRQDASVEAVDAAFDDLETLVR
jgi:subtilisin-like proprotein convertase family protein/Zn-dependent metalloprotease